MNHAVVMIARPIELILQPKAQWILGIGILGSVYMQAEVNTYQQVGQIAKLKTLVRNDQKAEEKEDEQIFKQPISDIRGPHVRADPDSCEDKDKSDQPVV